VLLTDGQRHIENGRKARNLADVIHNPPNERELDELFVFCSVDGNGMRGIVASILPGLGSTPFVTGSPTAVEAMKPMALEIARETGKRVELYRFTRGPVLWATDG
jgi:hypothetical protein